MRLLDLPRSEFLCITHGAFAGGLQRAVLSCLEFPELWVLLTEMANVYLDPK